MMSDEEIREFFDKCEAVAIAETDGVSVSARRYRLQSATFYRTMYEQLRQLQLGIGSRSTPKHEGSACQPTPLPYCNGCYVTQPSTDASTVLKGPERMATASAWIRAGDIYSGQHERRQKAFELCGELAIADSMKTWQWIERALEWAVENAKRDEPRGDRDAPEPVLCYIDFHTAYFTAGPLDKAWGDDWGQRGGWGRPYGSHNLSIAGHAAITEVVFDGVGFLIAPCTFRVVDINGGAAPWLTEQYPPRTRSAVRIMAGTTLSEFKRLVRLAGGSVFVFESGEEATMDKK